MIKRTGIILGFFLFLYITAVGQLPGFKWAEEFGNPPPADAGMHICSSPDGTWMAGEYQLTATFGDQSVTALGGWDIYVAQINDLGSVESLFSLGGVDYEYLKAFEIGDDGSLIFGVGFFGETVVGDSTFVSSGAQDIYIAKFSAQGDFLWANHIESAKTCYIKSIAIDEQGDVFLAGRFYDQVIIGGSEILSYGSADIYLAQYSSAGSLLWSTHEGGESSDYVHDIALDNEGGFFLTGGFYYPIFIGDIPLEPNGPTGLFLAYYNSEKSVQWAHSITGVNLENNSLLESAPDNSVYFAGNFTESITLGSIMMNAGAYNQNIYVSRFNQFGDANWVNSAGGTEYDALVSIDTDINGDLYLGGSYLMDITFGPFTLIYTMCCGSREAFQVKADATTGDYLYATQITGAQSDLFDIAIGEPDEFYAAGMYLNDIQFGDITLSSDEHLNYVSLQRLESVGITSNERVSMSLFPSPTTNTLYISGLTVFDFEIYNSIGERVLSGNGNTVNVIDLQPGMYVIRVDDGGSSLFSKFIKQ